MESPREKFQNLLRELFQFDCADLDFGIYRIMNHKHEVIERFIIEDLPKAIGAADYEREKRFLAAQGILEGMDEIFTNGDSLIPGARSLDGLFKSRMFGGAEAWI